MVTREVSNWNIIFAVKVWRIAVQPNAFVVFFKRLTGSFVKLRKSFDSLVNTVTDRSYELDLILAEVAGDVLVIAERVWRLSKSSLTVHTESFTLNAEFSAVVIFACGHIFTSNSSVLLNVVYHGDTVIYSVKHSSGRICMSLCSFIQRNE